MKFPGVVRMLRFPVVASHVVFVPAKGYPFWPRKMIERKAMVLSNRFIRGAKYWQAEATQMIKTKDDGTIELEFELIALSKPAVYGSSKTPRGTYRILKKLERRISLEAVARGFKEAKF